MITMIISVALSVLRQRIGYLQVAGVDDVLDDFPMAQVSQY